MKKANNFQMMKVKPLGVALLLLNFFSNFRLAFHIEALLIKKKQVVDETLSLSLSLKRKVYPKACCAET